MGRKLKDIQDQIISGIEQDEVLGGKLTSTSKTAIWRLLAYVVAYAIYLHEQIVEENARNSRPHTRRWYREQALAFRNGQELVWKDGQFRYDPDDAPGNEEPTDRVKQVAVTEAANGVLIIKTATVGQNVTQPLSQQVHGRFVSYMNQIKDAGNRLNFINQEADDLKLKLKVWVDPLIYDLDTGEDLRNPGEFPIEAACRAYLSDLEFNGAYVKTYLVDAVQQVDGVEIPKIINLSHRVLTNPYEDIEEYVLPYAGHFHYAGLEINYVSYEEVV